MDYRPLSPRTDAAAVAALLAAGADHDGHPPLSEEKHRDFAAGGARGRGVVAERSGGVAGYAHALPAADGRWQVELALAPGGRSPAGYRRLAEEALAALPDGARAQVWAFADDQAAALHDLGMTAERELRQMRRPLPAPPPAVPAGVDLRPFRPGRDDDTWLATHNDAFASGDGPGWTAADLADRTGRDWFDASGFLLAWDGPDLVGYCWTKVHPGRIGEIYIIGIATAHRGRGLGETLVLAGLADAHRRRGCTTAMLYVDGSNEPAVRLYERLGFSTVRTDRCFSLPSGSAQPNR